MLRSKSKVAPNQQVIKSQTTKNQTLSLSPPSFTIKKTRGGKFIFKGEGIQSGTYLEVGKDGFMQGRIKLGDAAKGKGLATKMFQTLSSGTLGGVKGVKGTWLKSSGIRDNFDAFMKVYDPKLGNMKEAAFSTATGKIAKRLGYNNIDVKNSTIDGGQVTMKFIK